MAESQMIMAEPGDGFLSKAQLGRIYFSFGVKELVDQFEVKPRLSSYLLFHRLGDWGMTVGLLERTAITRKELEEGSFATDDLAKQNLISLKQRRGRIHSIYDDAVIGRFWIITDLNRNTTLLLPNEY